MALAESTLLKVIKDVLGFNPNKKLDIFCLVVVLIGAIFVVFSGLLAPGLVLFSSIIVIYFILHALLTLLGWVTRKAIGGLTFGWLIDRRIRKLTDQEKFILHCFVDDDTLTNEFNLSQNSEVYFHRLVEKGFLTSFAPTIPTSDRGRLEQALGNQFVEATMSRKIFDYLTEDYCRNALRLGFTLYRADVRQHHRTQ